LADDGAVFGLSFWEIAIILMVALIILGPKKLPEIARSLGKGIREFRRATDDFKSTMDYEMNRPEQPKNKQLAAKVDDAELVPDEPEADAQKAAAAAAQAAQAVEAARVDAAPAEPSSTKPTSVG
jgi:TatA/E family protein of Tat protein translocase